jgi:hypothetical protein
MLIFAKLTGFEGHSGDDFAAFTVPHPFTTLERCLDNLGQSWTILDISFDSFRMSSLKAFRLHRPEFVLESCWDAVELPAPFQLLSSQRSGSEADWQEEFQSLCQELGLEHHIAIHSIIRSSHDIFVLRYLR